ncbi:MAG: protein TolR [Sphingomonas sp.]|jgi:biopolymer transport protein TolR|uniref:protein TolR n=1 Tax=Sphingomonas sp. TaxID=28214 RepID=UPI0025EB051F|nr:protein TolR [Sphingomonas sp.]MBX9882726.1 protein TolR [Sphingomonas sp.]
MAMNLPSHRGRGRRAPLAEINVTPLVDVMLVLLIIFMVTAPLMTAGVPVNLPDSRAKPVDQDQKPVQIALDEAGRLFVDDKPVADAQLPATLEKLAAANKERQVFLRADRKLAYAEVIRVLGELNRAGLNRVALLTVAKER